MKKIIIPVLLSTTLLFCGCGKEMNITTLQKNCNKDIATVQKVISNSFVPTNNTLTIPSFEYELSNTQETTSDNNLSSWNVVFSKPITQEIASNYTQPMYPFQYTNIIATYTPRYTSSLTAEITGLNKFINKLENLYLQMQDSLIVSHEINEIQKNFNFQLSLIKEKINTMQNKKDEITASQLSNANEILKELVKISENIKESDKQLRNLSDEIDLEKNNLILNTDSLSNKYIKIVNILDNKFSYLNNIQQCLNQLDLIVFGNSDNNIQSSNHYIDSDILKPISRDEYVAKYKDYFKTEVSYSKPSKKVPLPYIIDTNTKSHKKQYM